SGKSSLLKAIAGLLQPDSGAVFFEDIRVKGPLEQLIPGHPHIAYLSQHFELRNHYRVHEVLDMSRLVDEIEGKRIAEVCRISHLLQRRTDQISGGERQRIALARLLGTAPKLLILDEPFSNLDLPHKLSLLEVLEDAAARLGTSFLLAAHDPQDVMGWAERVLVLRAGRIVAAGSPESLYAKPESSYVAGLFGKYNLVRYGSQLVMLRPEDLLIDPNPGMEGSLIGTLKALRFQGFFQELCVEIGGQELLAFVVENRWFRIGQQLRVAIRKKLVVADDWLQK
ncbi:MAG: ABC transporter ATP-binding protein, partial [Bacteroidetes bacterium]|nr:ABC transporter ATP-binding protein [Bacteroidota bacterium]